MAIFLSGHQIERPAAAWQDVFSRNLGVRIAVTTIADGNMSYRYGPAEEVGQSRLRVFARLGLTSDRVLSLGLGSGSGVYWLDLAPEIDGTAQNGFSANGLWLADASRALFFFVADCFPLAFFDERSGAIGVLHAGRAELEAGLLRDFLAVAVEHEVKLDQLRVFVGPGICASHYVFNELPAGHRGTAIRDVQGIYHLDLRKDIRDTLQSAGVKSEKIVEDPRCTFESGDLFSHRRDRDQREGRFALILERHA